MKKAKKLFKVKGKKIFVAKKSFIDSKITKKKIPTKKQSSEYSAKQAKNLKHLNVEISVADKPVKPGTREVVLFPAPNINTQVKIEIPVHVFHGKRKGPMVFITGTIHGDEINSIEILRRVQNYIKIKKLSGTIIIIPVVNVYGLILQSRYLPDGRDLNRSFPGSKEGSLASRLAHGLLQLIEKCNYGIDLHTGAIGRVNIPQLRTNFEVPGAKNLAKAFAAPVILDAKLRDGSIRQAASELNIPLLVYEGGEALRFNEVSVKSGVNGIMNVLRYLKMLPQKKSQLKMLAAKKAKTQKQMIKPKTAIATGSRWIRASVSGLVQPIENVLGREVKKGDVIAHIHDPFLINKSVDVVVPFNGIVIGQALKPVASTGDALYHVATFEKLKEVGDYLDELADSAMGYD